MRTIRNVGVLGMGFLAGLSVLGCNPNPTTPGGDTAGKALVANLRGADGAQAEVEFVQRDGHTEFALAVSGGQPGGSVEVTINGVVVLSILLDDFGNARVEFDSAPDELGEDALPASFPNADDGDSLGVGELHGSFEDNDNKNDSADDDDDEQGGDDGDDADEFELEAAIFAPDSSLKAKVKFESEGVKSKLDVHVRGGAPGSTLDVVVGGVTLTTLTLDAYGSAEVEFKSNADDDDELPFPAGFVAPVAGTAVAVGALSGTLQASSDDEDDDDDNGNDNSDSADDNENVNDNVNGNDNGP